MTNINLTSENINTFKTDLINSMASDLKGLKVKTFYGEGDILTITNFDESPLTFYFSVNLNNTTKTIAFGKKYPLNTYGSDIENILNNYMPAINNLITFKKEQLTAARNKADDDKKAKADKIKEERKKANFDKHINEVITDLNKTINEKIDFTPETIEWIKQHYGTISAQLPQYTVSWFEKRFGTIDTNKSVAVVDDDKKTSGGNRMKWNPSFSISFKKFDSVPNELDPYMDYTKKKINNTKLVFSLLYNYGFDFGKNPNT